MNVPERLEALRKAMCVNWQELGDALELSRTMLHYLRKGESEISPKAERRLRDLEASALAKQPPVSVPPGSKAPSNWGGAFWGTTNLVPIISWASAGSANAYEDQGHDVPTIPSGCKDPNCYALEIEGNSMEPFYESGDIVVVMPNFQAQHGQLVIARLDDDSVYFKKLVIGRDPQRIRLVSFNLKYEPMDVHRRDVRFLHPVHSMTRVFAPQHS